MHGLRKQLGLKRVCMPLTCGTVNKFAQDQPVRLHDTPIDVRIERAVKAEQVWLTNSFGVCRFHPEEPLHCHSGPASTTSLQRALRRQKEKRVAGNDG